jgi:hypothetical protein
LNLGEDRSRDLEVNMSRKVKGCRKRVFRVGIGWEERCDENDVKEETYKKHLPEIRRSVRSGHLNVGGSPVFDGLRV